jgi:hypothetical protein
MAVGVSGVVGQNVSVRAYLDRTNVPVGQRFVLSIEVNSTNQAVTDPVVADLSSFARFLGSGSSQQMNIAGGRTTVTRTLQYQYLTTAEGTFQIPAASVTVSGTPYQTEPIAITVGPAPAGGAPGAGAETGVPGLSDGDIFVRATASQTTAYPNQPVILEYRIYTRVNVRQYNFEPPTTAGFFVEEFPQPQSPVTTNEVINGQNYVTASIRKMAVFPTSVGEKTIDPVRVTAGIEVRNQQSRDPFDSFFRLGARNSVVEYDVFSNPLTIDVQPFPPQAPSGFTGHVGSLTINASVDSATVERDNAITFSLRVEGVGNLKTLALPEVEFPNDFEVYPPDVVERDDWQGDRRVGERSYDYVVIPRSPGTKTIPSIQLAFYDDQMGTYRTVRTAPINIEVTGEPVEGPVITGGARREVRSLRDDIRFIETEVPSFSAVETRRIGGGGFWLVLILPLTVVGGAYVTRRQRDRLSGDQAYARHRRSSRRARKRLSAARAVVAPDKASEFFAESEKALQGFLGDRLNVSEAGFIRDEVLSDLKQRGVERSVVDEYFDCIDLCAAKRFAPGDTSVDEMKKLLERAEQAMTKLEKQTS